MKFDEVARSAAEAARDRAQQAQRPPIERVSRSRSLRSGALVMVAAFVATIIVIGSVSVLRESNDVAMPTSTINAPTTDTSAPPVQPAQHRSWSIAHPADWYRADSDLMPALGWRSLTLATFPLEPGGDCAHMPTQALRDMMGSDALVTVFLSGVAGPAWPEGGFDDDVFPAAEGPIDARECAGRADLELHWGPWSLGDSGVYVLVAFGDEVASERRAETWAVLSSLHPGDDGVAAGGGACVVTRPTDPGFVAPVPHPPRPAHDSMAWFGDGALWTALPRDAAYTPRKSVWWSIEYAGEERPDVAVTFERIDSDNSVIVEGPPGTGGFTDEDGWFLIAGLDPETPGCWRATGSFGGVELSYVFEVPHDAERVSALESRADAMSSSLARIDEEIANLEETLETASDDVAAELRDRIVVVQEMRRELLLNMTALQRELDAAAGG